MTSQVVSFREIESVENVERILNGCFHNGFPVLTFDSKVLYVVTREELVKRLIPNAGRFLDFRELDSSHLPFISETDDSFLQCYRLFRRCGLRHLIIVDSKTKSLAGIITRIDLVEAINNVAAPHFYYPTI